MAYIANRGGKLSSFRDVVGDFTENVILKMGKEGKRRDEQKQNNIPSSGIHEIPTKNC